MPLSLPEDRDEVLSRIRTDVQAELPNLNPFIANVFESAMMIALAGRSFESFEQIQNLIDEIFPHTATVEFLEMWGSLKGITRNDATRSSGSITITGVASTIVPNGSALATTDGQSYTTQSEATIAATSLSVASLTRIGSVATTITTEDHNLASGMDITISGANEAEYNGTFTITVTGLNTFTYEVTGTPATPATGTILVDFTGVSALVLSDNFGKESNQPLGTALNFSTPIVDVDTTAFVQFGEIAGGTDQETDSDLRERILDAFQNPVALFNVSQIEIEAKKVAGVTRVFVQEATPDPGQVTVYFTRDNDESPIPSGSEITSVKDNLLVIKPAHVSDADVIVLAPVAVNVDFTFTSITPSTSTMRTAIINNLEQFFSTKPEIGVDIRKIDYECAINSTFDTQTGNVITDFTLSTPTTDITINDGELGLLGTITFL